MSGGTEPMGTTNNEQNDLRADERGRNRRRRSSAAIPIRWYCWSAGRRCCRGQTRCASGSRRVVGGWSGTTCATAERRRRIDPEAPGYGLRDLAADAAALVDTLGAVTAHLGGVGVGGMVAQVAALDHPKRVLGADAGQHPTGCTGPGRRRPARIMTRRPWPRCSPARGPTGPTDPPSPRSLPTAPSCWAMTRSRRARPRHGSGIAHRRANPRCIRRISSEWCSPGSTAHRGGVQRLGELTLPTLVVHGRADPFFPVGNGEALAAAIPAARLLVLDDMGTALRDAASDKVTAAMLAL